LESAEDWAAGSRKGLSPWDLWGASPALEALVGGSFFGRLGLPERARVAVPGCGRGHDLRLLGKMGFAVTGFDLSPRAVAEARQLLQLNRVPGRVLRRDVLGLSPEFDGAFDLVFEYTCFCSQPPHLRLSYARSLAGLLAPGGYVLGLMFPMDERFAGADGPPYLVREADLEATFGAELRLRQSFGADVPGSPRAGAERWYLWQKDCGASPQPDERFARPGGRQGA